MFPQTNIKNLHANNNRSVTPFFSLKGLKFNPAGLYVHEGLGDMFSSKLAPFGATGGVRYITPNLFLKTYYGSLDFCFTIFSGNPYYTFTTT
jgi:hypothetical protein